MCQKYAHVRVDIRVSHRSYSYGFAPALRCTAATPTQGLDRAPHACCADNSASLLTPMRRSAGGTRAGDSYVGDPRIVPLSEIAGTVPAGTTVPWGRSGGHCDVKPPYLTAAFAAVGAAGYDAMLDPVGAAALGTAAGTDDAPDPNCSRGVLSKLDNLTCCAASCGVCGGKDCGGNPGGAHSCCRKDVGKQGRSCDVVGPPCVEGSSPAPGPPAPLGPYANRCTAPGSKGTPKPTPNGFCVGGCLFNVTDDPTESKNLFNDPAFASTVAAMKARLAVLGKAAPPWAAAPEVQHMSKDEYAGAMCSAAKRFGALAPIDI